MCSHLISRVHTAQIVAASQVLHVQVLERRVKPSLPVSSLYEIRYPVSCPAVFTGNNMFDACEKWKCGTSDWLRRFNPLLIPQRSMNGFIVRKWRRLRDFHLFLTRVELTWNSTVARNFTNSSDLTFFNRKYIIHIRILLRFVTGAPFSIKSILSRTQIRIFGHRGATAPHAFRVRRAEVKTTNCIAASCY